ncbi:MAG TPA: hypothetical protein ENJ56_01465 [Anaerolineae bacterium]|nr:hypothetical protein [Anaerolineae bacterium]
MSELQTFVLNYLEESGGIAEAAGAATFDVLLPEETAQALGVDSLQTWSFAETSEATADDGEVQHLLFNSPVVERMIEAARANPTVTRYVIDHVRLNKQGVADLARQAWLLPNARITERRKTTALQILNSYLLFNFKSALISDDKQEQLVSVLVDVQGGYVLNTAEAAQILATAHPLAHERELPAFPNGRVRWQIGTKPPPPSAFELEALEVLLDKAKQAVADILAEPIKRLQKRSKRFLTLDEARLNAYYDEIEQDLRQRSARATGERKANLLEKLALTAAERQHKLADAAARYQVHINLTLINSLLIQQPKLALPLHLHNRHTQRDVVAVYDPLLHRVEPLLCAVCGKTGQRLQLCHNGHLAHADCLAPACTDCKRVYCQLCSDQLGSCAVCDEPLCKISALTCPQCGRKTCQAHRNLCHANNGAPADLTAVPPPVEPVTTPKVTAKPPPRPKPRPRPKSPSRKKPRRSAEPRLVWPKGVPKPQRIEVVVDPHRITAFLLASRERTIASRVWELSADTAINRSCECEKGDQCEANGYILRPAYGVEGLLRQMKAEIEAFRKEYRISSKKITFNQQTSPYLPPTPLRRFQLMGKWIDEEFLAVVREAFDDYVADT